MRTSAGVRSAPFRRGRRALRHLVFFGAIVLIVDAIVGERGLVALLKARQQYRIVQGSLTRARAENARLREQAYGLREDSRIIEGIARREFGWVRPDEKLFIVKDAPVQTARPR